MLAGHATSTLRRGTRVKSAAGAASVANARRPPLSRAASTVGVIGAMMGGVLGAAAVSPLEAMRYIREGERR